MFSRPLLFGGVLAACVGVPYLLTDEKLSATAKGQFNRLLGTSEREPVDPLAGLSLPSFDKLPIFTSAPAGPPLAAQPVQDLGEVFRFDVTPLWVTQRWQRVSTVTSETDLQGLRVPLVTGTQPHDVAGSLTYYFDKQHRVQRLTFQGYTGDHSRLSNLVAQHYHLQPAPTLAAGLLLAKWNNKPVSVLRIEHVPVVNAGAVNARQLVLLELNRPGNPLSDDMRGLLEHDQQVKRW